MILAGVDGCKAGWVAVIEDGGERRVEIFPGFAAVLRAADLIAIDVPIGLTARTPRLADRAARERLGARACCVFSAPYRAMLAARSYRDACAIRRDIDGRSCTRQAFGIFARIAEVDARMTPRLQRRVFEGHREISFALMNGGPALAERKKSAAGVAARARLLARHFREVESIARLPGAGTDDVLDAYALLWTARRAANGKSIRIPPGIERDERGLRAEIIA